MKQTLTTLAGLLLLMVAANVRAETLDDIITLAQKGVGEDVMLATVENSQSDFQLSVADIVKLKDGKVPDKVIAAMLRHHPQAPAPAPVAIRARQAETPVEAARPAAGATGTLNFENVDEKVWSYSYEPASKTIWITSQAADGRGNLDPHGGLSVKMAAGAYKVRYNGQDRGAGVTVFSGEKSLLMLSRVETAEREALYVTVFERGERKATAKLATLRDDKQAATQTSPEKVVERERIVEVPSTTTVIQPAPVYTYDVGTPYYYNSYYPYYYGPRYYYPSNFGFGYSNFHHRGGWGVRFGF